MGSLRVAAGTSKNTRIWTERRVLGTVHGLGGDEPTNKRTSFACRMLPRGSIDPLAPPYGGLVLALFSFRIFFSFLCFVCMFCCVFVSYVCFVLFCFVCFHLAWFDLSAFAFLSCIAGPASGP